MCVAYADVELLDLMYIICSLNLTPIVLPDCPTYTLLHVLHFLHTERHVHTSNGKQVTQLILFRKN